MEHQRSDEMERGGIILQTSKFEMKECNIIKLMSKPQPPPTPLAKTAAGSENVVGSLVYINNHKQTTSQLKHSIIGQQFEILGILGTGCYGRTYKVVDKLRYFKQFALKRTKTHFQQSIKEATTLLELNNPCIIPIFSCWREQDSLFMETSLGDLSLQEILDNYGALPESLFWAIAQDISYALDECFSKQIAHLDVKPSNVLVVHQRYFGDIINNFNRNEENFVVGKQLIQFNVSSVSCDVDNYTPNLITYENLRVSGLPVQYINGPKQILDGDQEPDNGKELILSDFSEQQSQDDTVKQDIVDITPTNRKTPTKQRVDGVLSPNLVQRKKTFKQNDQENNEQQIKRISQQLTVTYEPPLQKLSCSNISDIEDRCIFQLIDFGQSQKAQNDQFNECNCGDSAYVDYQFMQTSKPSFYSDLFSFGIMLLELITGIKLPVQGILFEKLRTQQWYECFPNNMFGTNLRDIIEYKSDELINAQVQISIPIWRAIGDILSGKVQNIRQWRQKYWDMLSHQKRQDIYQLIEKFNQMQFDVQYEQLETKCIVLSRDLLKQLQLRKTQKSAGPKLLKSKKSKSKNNSKRINKSNTNDYQIPNTSNVGFVPLDNFSGDYSKNQDVSKNDSCIHNTVDQEDKSINMVLSKHDDNNDQDDIDKQKITSQSLEKNKSQAVLSARRKELIYSQIQSLRDFIIKGGRYCKGNHQTFIKQDMMGSVTILKTSDVLLDQQQPQQQLMGGSYGPASLISGTELQFTTDGRNISPDWQNEQVVARPSHSSHELLMDGALSFNDNELNQIFFQDDQASRQKMNSFVHLSVLESCEEGQNENLLSMEEDPDQCNGLDAAVLCMQESDASLARQDSDFIKYNAKNDRCSDSKTSTVASGVILSKQLDSENHNTFFNETNDSPIVVTQNEAKEFILSNQSKNKDGSPYLNNLNNDNRSVEMWRISDEQQQKNSVIQMGTETPLTEKRELPDRANLMTPPNDDNIDRLCNTTPKDGQAFPKNVKLILPDQQNKQSTCTSVFQQCKSSSNALLSGGKLDSQIDISTGKPDADILGMSRRSSSEISLQSHQGAPYTRFEEISTENRAVEEGNGQSANFVLSEAVKVESDYSSGESMYSESCVPKTLQDAYIRSTRVFGSLFSAIETLTGVGTMVYFPTYKDLYRTPTLPNLSSKDKNINSKNCSEQNLVKSAPASTNIITTDLFTGHCNSNANNLPPPSKKSISKHLQYHELSDLNHLNFQGRFRPLSGNYNILRKAELELHGYQTPRGNQNTHLVQSVSHPKSGSGIPRWVVFSGFNSAFMQYAYLLKFFSQLHIKNNNSFLFKSKGFVLFGLFLALIIVLHALNRRNQVVLVDAIYRQIGTSGVYVNMEKFLGSIYGFFAPIILYFTNFCYFMYTNGEAKVNYFVFNLVQDIFIFAFEKLVDYNYATPHKNQQEIKKPAIQKEYKQSQEKHSQKYSKKTKHESKIPDGK